MEIEYCSYKGFSKCIRLETGENEIIAVADFGPRVISCRRMNGINIFGELCSNPPKDGKFCLGGGHRLWIAPEDPETTYSPDNSEVDIQFGDQTAKLTTGVTSNGIIKVIEFSEAEPPFSVCVKHRLINIGNCSRKVVPWAVTIMSPGGFSVAPLARMTGCVYSPDRMFCFWPLSDITDKRFNLENDWSTLEQSQEVDKSFKVGIYSPYGLLSYFLGDTVFIKRTRLQTYPLSADFGVNLELYTDSNVMELETLGGQATLRCGEEIEHVEEWVVMNPPKHTLSNIKTAAQWILDFTVKLGA